MFCHQSIADALSADGIFHLAALGDKESDRLGGAAIADAALRCPVRLPQEAQIADARPRGNHLSLRTGPFQQRNLERKSVGDTSGSVKTARLPSDGLGYQCLLVVLAQAALVGELECSTNLHARGALRQRSRSISGLP